MLAPSPAYHGYDSWSHHKLGGVTQAHTAPICAAACQAAVASHAAKVSVNPKTAGCAAQNPAGPCRLMTSTPGHPLATRSRDTALQSQATKERTAVQYAVHGAVPYFKPAKAERYCTGRYMVQYLLTDHDAWWQRRVPQHAAASCTGCALHSTTHTRPQQRARSTRQHTTAQRCVKCGVMQRQAARVMQTHTQGPQCSPGCKPPQSRVCDSTSLTLPNHAPINTAAQTPSQSPPLSADAQVHCACAHTHAQQPSPPQGQTGRHADTSPSLLQHRSLLTRRCTARACVRAHTCTTATLQAQAHTRHVTLSRTRVRTSHATLCAVLSLPQHSRCLHPVGV